MHPLRPLLRPLSPAALLLALACGGAAAPTPTTTADPGAGSGTGGGGGAPAAPGGGAGEGSAGGATGTAQGGSATPADPALSWPSPVPGYHLVWHDEFDGSGLDPTKWTAQSFPRRDAAATPDAVSVANGLLTLTTYTENGQNYTGFLSTEHAFESTYGYYEARIRFQDAPGEWCAFWMFASTVGNPVGDPGTAGAEIDVVEHRVTDTKGWDALRDMVQQALHWDGYGADRKDFSNVTTLPDGAPVQGEWHTYAVLWTPAGYAFYVDGAQVWSFAQGISNRSEFLQLTCEVEDGTWAGYVPAGGYGTRAASTTHMDVDWVRVWQPAP
ncbi:glycoside hydrolase family 16 protein [Anaeromyxobacter paludicola]|uniref:GH16 domain-containing protein n=1 Tax=Anaeromyxobacter paludicola TaxID=2918171 RepID=A0ABN6N4E4_9BACT|nr:glycoside hydrolase family 16 protein [Anaeromyxobacter paludicola]BDG07876.1 hypothetical protein AMPC_09890 [Anaeromyxobacter paludicola]